MLFNQFAVLTCLTKKIIKLSPISLRIIIIFISCSSPPLPPPPWTKIRIAHLLGPWTRSPNPRRFRLCASCRRLLCGNRRRRSQCRRRSQLPTRSFPPTRCCRTSSAHWIPSKSMSPRKFGSKSKWEDILDPTLSGEIIHHPCTGQSTNNIFAFNELGFKETLLQKMNLWSFNVYIIFIIFLQ